MANFVLTAGADLFPATVVDLTGDDVIEGLDGNDTIDAGAGRDTIYGGLGDDILRGGAGHDLIFAGNGSDQAWGGSGNDTVVGYFDSLFAALQGGSGTDSLALVKGPSGATVSTIVVTALNNGFQVNLDGRVISAQSFEQLYVESDTALHFTGGAEANEVVSLAGRSRIFTGAGDDLVFVERSVVAKGLADKLDGGAGRDFLQVDTSKLDSWMNVTFDAAGTGRYSTALGNNSSFTGFETVEFIAGTKLDRIDFSGQAIALRVFQPEGVATDYDIITGGTLNDYVESGSGRDTVRTGAGDDTIDGGSGFDIMAGGAGADVFLFTQASHSSVAVSDRIEDFTSRAMAAGGPSDIIDLFEVRALAGLQSLSFIGQGAFTAAGQIRVVDLGADLAVEVNLTGASGAEMRMVLAGVADAGLISSLDFLA